MAMAVGQPSHHLHGFSASKSKSNVMGSAGQSMLKSHHRFDKQHSQRMATSQLNSLIGGVGLGVHGQASKMKLYQGVSLLEQQSVIKEERKLNENKPSTPSDPQPKEVFYSLPNVKIGQGKYGPIELVLYNSELCALKRIPKVTIDKAKRIEHLKNEKKVNLALKNLSNAASAGS